MAGRSKNAFSRTVDACEPTSASDVQRYMNGEGLPEWALDVLASPSSNQSLIYDKNSLRCKTGADAFVLEAGIAHLTIAEDPDLVQVQQRFPVYAANEHQVLRPTQVRFRQILRKFLGQVEQGAIVVDIASAECEFRSYFEHLRYLPMDLSVRRLERAIQLGRTEIGVVANIRRPPLREQSVPSYPHIHSFISPRVMYLRSYEI